jgi:hypothetical protein
MKIRKVFPVLALAGVIAAAGLAVADHHEKAGDQDHEAMMAEYMKLAAPGEHHAHMAKMEGKWKAESKMWMEPGSEPQMAQGKAMIEPILGGRFMQMTYHGNFMDQQFEGRGISGYDNLKNKHTDIWMDTMGTFFMVSEGNCSDGGKALEMRGDFQDPSGQTHKTRTVSREISDDRMVFEMYMVDPSSGNEFKHMEITYTRM